MPGWERPAGLVYEEINKQAVEEGKDPTRVEALRPRYEAIGEDAAANDQLLRELQTLPIRADFPFTEPSALEEILALRPSEPATVLPPLTEDRAELLDRLHGAWIGRCVGCALGKPFESMGMRGVQDVGGGVDHGTSAHAKGTVRLRPWQRLKRYLTAISPDEWPIRDYIPGNSPAASDPNVGPAMCPLSTREQIAYMETDDDIRYTVLALEMLRDKGLSFTTWDVACGWMRRLPYFAACTAETQAYHNLVSRYEFHAGSDFMRRPPEVDWDWVASHRNPYREWIGAQIRVDAYGYVAAGLPTLAAELAWRDARMSHTKNGIYGAMFCAAMIATAFVSSDPTVIVRRALAEIPASSRLAAALRGVIARAESLGGADADFERVFDELHADLESYSTVHTIPNAALCATAVLHSGGDFTRGVTLAVMGGWDTDCNGATVGSIVGAMQGARRVPSVWHAPLNDTLRSGIVDYHPIAISECAARTLEVLLAGRPS